MTPESASRWGCLVLGINLRAGHMLDMCLTRLSPWSKKDLFFSAWGKTPILQPLKLPVRLLSFSRLAKRLESHLHNRATSHIRSISGRGCARNLSPAPTQACRGRSSEGQAWAPPQEERDQWTQAQRKVSLWILTVSGL